MLSASARRRELSRLRGGRELGLSMRERPHHDAGDVHVEIEVDTVNAWQSCLPRDAEAELLHFGPVERVRALEDIADTARSTSSRGRTESPPRPSSDGTREMRRDELLDLALSLRARARRRLLMLTGVEARVAHVIACRSRAPGRPRSCRRARRIARAADAGMRWPASEASRPRFGLPPLTCQSGIFLPSSVVALADCEDA